MWIYNNKKIEDCEVPEDKVGFVYLITNTKTGQKYIGKKNLWKPSKKEKAIKKDGTESKRNAPRGKVASNWKSYYGSSKSLTADVKALGKDCFKREILEFCPTPAVLSLTEVEYQVRYEVLKSDDWYNDCIKITCYKKNIKGKV